MCEALDATSKAEAGKTGDFVLGETVTFAHVELTV
ncbi:hypothetical protein QF035_008905 [Streptomyces umbrinus]|uniref:Uncharacterized protein n=1 Tax=Streptomyces umbrinus TaxID=67370 RepID=A0ABU0T692_9ACTN|nr:hypothetical protein [Streptomyces umbrinus]